MRRVTAAVPGLLALLVAGLLVGIFAALLLPLRRELRDEVHRRIIERDAAVLHPVALNQLSEAVADPAAPPAREALLTVLSSARQNGMLGVAVYDAEGVLLRAVPAARAFLDLPPEDFLEVAQHRRLSRYHADYPLQPIVGSDDSLGESSPVLEVLLPLSLPGQPGITGVVQYWLDARPLARELAEIDTQITEQTTRTFAGGAALIGLVVLVSYRGLVRAQRVIAERNERLVRANLELALAAKASVLGQITSHLLHGLQGPVAGLRAVIAARGGDQGEDWQTAADYTARLQRMIGETVTLLSERSAATAYELTGTELAGLLRQRHAPAAAGRRVSLTIEGGFSASLDSNRGNLLCLLAGNLIENAIDASPAGAAVLVTLSLADDDTVRLAVTDAGPGVPPEVRQRLFQPGQSRKPGGTGLGLSISHLLALQLGGSIQLRETGPAGTTFAVAVPRLAPR